MQHLKNLAARKINQLLVDPAQCRIEQNPKADFRSPSTVEQWELISKSEFQTHRCVQWIIY